ncbi:DUF1508 domain-containing protein [Dysgonomonas sp. ZJ709]|uniref:DUF1508 domain-containing protein n=1 Tax=Dysgonomonas sp. ZJ709 TaxID=2709797 RepID=UPI0013EB2940|nr:DUF1508 domain-containing protein [Dysgonomonas sp. ZJ709]
MKKKEDTFTFYPDKRGKFRWKRLASNGITVGDSSQGYANKSYCKENAVRNGYDESKHITVYEW